MGILLAKVAGLNGGRLPEWAEQREAPFPPAATTPWHPSPDPSAFPSQLKAQTQGTSEELRCLQLLNRLQELSELEELMSSQPCFRLALGIQDYVAMVRSLSTWLLPLGFRSPKS